jgi:hypothetical protein
MMLVLHGSWVLAQGTVPARFVLWGETTEPPRTTSARGLRGARPSVLIAAHPFAPKTHRLLDMLIRLRLRDEADMQLVRSLVIQLPSARGVPLPSPTLAAGIANEAGGEIRSWRVDGLVFEAPVATGIVAALDTQSLTTAALGDDLRYWAEVSRFVLALLCRQRILPAVQQEGSACRARWLPLLTDEGDAQAVSVIAGAMPPACRALAWDIGATPVRPETLLRAYLATVVESVARQALQQAMSGSAESVTWLRALRDTDTMRDTPATLARLTAGYRAWAAPAIEESATTDALLGASFQREREPVGAAPVPPLPSDPHTFWALPPGFSAHPCRCVAPAVDALPVKRLGVPPFWRSPDAFMPLMENWYRTIGAEAELSWLKSTSVRIQNAP